MWTKQERRILVIGTTGILAVFFTILATAPRNGPTPAAAKPATVAAVKKPQQPQQSVPAYTTRDLMLHNMADAAGDKQRAVLYVSRNAPRITLYSTQATHPACNIDGKPMRVAEVGRGGFTCYRWVGDMVALRIEGDRFMMQSVDGFRTR